jgi:hypothetical protein
MIPRRSAIATKMSAISGAQFGRDVLEMNFDGLCIDEQVLCDLAIPVALRDEL